MKQWDNYAGEVKGEKVALPSYDKVLMSTELVVDDQNRIQEVNRVHGENEVAPPSHPHTLTPSHPHPFTPSPRSAW